MKKALLLGTLALFTLAGSALAGDSNTTNFTADTDATESMSTPADTVEQPSPAWTRADCHNAWKYNMKSCNTSPPNMRPACWAAASALLAACMASAKG